LRKRVDGRKKKLRRRRKVGLTPRRAKGEGGAEVDMVAGGEWVGVDVWVAGVGGEFEDDGGMSTNNVL
jgi:hypothetical protein